MKSLEVHMQNAAELSGGEEIYIFRWLSNQFDELSKEETPVLKDLTNEVIKYIPDLVSPKKLKKFEKSKKLNFTKKPKNGEK